jgi:diguanylate cyclase (GGDEF)-like protein
MKIFSFLSLRQWLTLPFLALILAITVLIAALSYRTGSHAVQTVTKHLLLDKVGRIGQAIDRHLLGSAAAIEVAFPKGMFAPKTIESDMANLRTRFWTATSIHRDPNNYVYYGSRHGQFFGLWRHSEQDAELRYKFRPEDNRTVEQLNGMQGPAQGRLTEGKKYDPRLRPWYKAALATDDHVWTEVYLDFSSLDLVVTRARRVLDAEGILQGVVATDLSMRKLNEFVKQLSVSEHGVAFVFEPDGKLIASSHSANFIRQPDGLNARLTVAAIQDPLQREAYLEIRKLLDSGVKLDGPKSQRFTLSSGETIELAFERVKDAGRLNWIVAVAAPQSDFIEGVNSNITRSVFVGLFGALVAVLIGLSVLEWVGRDLRRLTKAVHEVGQGQLEVQLDVHRKDEIGTLANALRQMQQRLRTDQLTGLVNRDMIVRSIDARINVARRVSDAKPFAVLFIDINNFKAINDRLGHEAGDQALMEIATRLRSAIRDSDLAARYAGDEFVLLLNDVSSYEKAEEIREHVEKTLQKPFDNSRLRDLSSEISLSGSVGMAMYPQGGLDPRALLQTADADMYKRKRHSQELSMAA